LVSHFSRQDHFRAEQVGAFIHLLSGHGEVVSIYAQVINILHPNKLIVSLVENYAQMTALSIRLPTLFRNLEATADDVKPGSKALFDGGRLIINGLYIDLDGAETCDGMIGPDDIRGFRLSKVPLIRDALTRKGKKGGLLGLIHSEEKENPFVQKASRLLTQVLTKGQGTLAIKGLSQLVGLGIGFTPSGDDFISGVLLAEKILNLLSSHQTTVPEIVEQRITPCSIDKEDIWNVQEKTTHGGRTLLWQALQAHFPYYLIEAARGLAYATTADEITNVVGRAVSHGETSGTDALVGLLFYLDSAVIFRG